MKNGERRVMSDDDVNRICDVVRETGFALHRFLGPGFREKTYEGGLVHRLSKAGLKVVSQHRCVIFDEDGTAIGEDLLDLVVEDVLVIELKAVRVTTDADVAQLLGYLKAGRFRHGLLINFGAGKFYIRKYVM